MLTFHSFNKYGQPICMLQNNTDTTYVIGAFSKWKDSSSRIFIEVQFSLQEKKKDEWKNNFMGWCGTGIRPDTLFPGEKRYINFNYYKIEDEAIKVSIGLKGINPSSDISRNLSSGEIKLK